MATEIERKFLVLADNWHPTVSGTAIKQGYLSSVAERAVRVRIDGDHGWLTVKGQNVGVERPEYEYPIPLDEAEEMLATLCERPLIEKTRYKVTVGSFVWDVDVFGGDNQGLVVAEIELPSADSEFERPGWIGDEVSDDPRYFNANLIHEPYSSWKTPVA